jgi:uncharacterized oxidoreductase
MMESNEGGPELGFEYESPEDVAEALVAGLEAGELEVVRGAEDRSAMTQMTREQPQELDEQVAQMKDELEKAVANHRSM